MFTSRTMNLLLLRPSEIDREGRVRLGGRRAVHLREVLRVELGQRLRAGIVRGPRVPAIVRQLGPELIELELELASTLEEPAPTLELILALPRPKALPRILEAAASFGVRRIDVVNAWRVDRAYFDSSKLAPEAMLEHLWLGCEQGRNTYLPEIAVHRRLLPFLEETWPMRRRAEPERQLLALHPEASHHLEEVVVPSLGVPLTIFIGPDGGFVESELGSLRDAGGQLVGLGRAVLRTETAVVAVLSQLALLARLAAKSTFVR